MPLALLAREFGHTVSGSDPKGAPGLEAFRDLDPSRLANQDAVVYSSAIPAEHAELSRARELSSAGSLRLFHRMDFLTEILSPCRVRIGVAGTHGKTSTTSLLGWVLLEIGADPTIFAGGKPLYLEKGIRKGQGPAVFETDESDGSFLRSRANYRICLNVDRDHLDHYGSFDRLKECFQEFLQQSGSSIVNALDPALKAPGVKTYAALSESEGEVAADYCGRFVGTTDSLEVTVGGKSAGRLEMPLPGRHFASNALAVFGLVHLLMERGEIAPLPPSEILRAIASFPGVERRMQQVGKVNGCPVFDDYGHHPSEIAAVIRALRVRFPGSRVRIVFQPHRYTRTREHAGAFADVLRLADEAFVLPLYSAGEKAIQGVDSSLIAGPAGASLVDANGIAGILDSAREGDVLLFQGAGDISAMIRRALSARL